MLLDVLEQIWCFIHENQSLVAGGLALLAAIIAARPVWRQLRSLNRQVEIQSLQLIEAQIDFLQRTRGEIDGRCSKIWQEATFAQYNGSYPWEDEDREEIDPHAAHSIEKMAHDLETYAYRLSSQHRLPSSCDKALDQLKEAANSVGNTLYHIHAPDSVDFSDPMLEIENREEAEKRAKGDASKAQKQIDTDIAEMNRSARALMEQLDSATDALLLRRQNIHEDSVHGSESMRPCPR